ncbi:DoxX-like family protein [Actinopolymorpha cephalotaxi]|uniref:DoxX-like family protein n=1 Tax=Actinopolymorpha cephalotaxi TaxID=504797 RepID=A0A1I2XSR4_9ACTN|nr:DoxX family protein [Actinopolymorpha cephalotaxi]NYH87135.1 putative membrane protein YphA (DoxX/SURF4 family) [Actinopolymorpha cephalotaxi]SFH15766.1 DoxX-like family protein [Actinopolymorpha cephalotaxi]
MSTTANAPTPSAERAGHRPGRRMNVTLWVVQALTAAFFLASGVPKLIAHPSATVIFDKIGFGDWFIYLTGSLELAGAIALLVPLLAGLAALAYIGLMVGAFITQVTVMDGKNAATPVIVAVVVGFIAWGRRGSTGELFRRVSPGAAGGRRTGTSSPYPGTR